MNNLMICVYLCQIWAELASLVDYPVAIAVACYLVQEGCAIEKVNGKKQTPFDLIGLAVQTIIKQYIPPNM